MKNASVSPGKASTEKKRPAATLALADGTVFRGVSIGAEGETDGETVFNTSMSGYQEILTDPSYVKQMITFTYPHIGNVGVNREDVESNKVQVAGVIIHELSEHYSNYRAEGSFEDYLKQNNVVGIAGIDTRALVLHLRTHGAQMGVIASGERNADDLVAKARSLPTMDGLDLVPFVSTKESYLWKEGIWTPGKGYQKFSDEELAKRPLVVAIDFGIKHNILRLLVQEGFRVQVVPANTSADEIMALNPQGIFLSNGPGDPAAVTYGIQTVKGVLGKKPIFGICLGHQILGHALGAPTFKLPFGHRGGNHPVRNLLTDKVEITVQNHGFATHASQVPKHVQITHLNLNDQTIEGLIVPDAKAFSVQYHPESSPGPQDARYLFRQFHDLVQ
ncbi:MAG: glutamine-hydrolyzing carbamoyl-phosphate synthase small subunit [Bdellovibrionota bacterium]